MSTISTSNGKPSAEVKTSQVPHRPAPEIREPSSQTDLPDMTNVSAGIIAPTMSATAGPDDAAEYDAQYRAAQMAWRDERPLVSSVVPAKGTDSPSVSPLDDTYGCEHGLTPEEEEHGPVMISGGQVDTEFALPPGYAHDEGKFRTARASIRTDPSAYRVQSVQKQQQKEQPRHPKLDRVHQRVSAWLTNTSAADRELDRETEWDMPTESPQQHAPENRGQGRNRSDTAITALPSRSELGADIRFDQAETLERAEKPRSEQSAATGDGFKATLGKIEGAVRRYFQLEKAKWTNKYDGPQIAMNDFLRSRKDTKFWAVTGLLVFLFFLFFILAVTGH